MIDEYFTGYWKTTTNKQKKSIAKRRSKCGNAKNNTKEWSAAVEVEVLKIEHQKKKKKQTFFRHFLIDSFIHFVYCCCCKESKNPNNNNTIIILINNNNNNITINNLLLRLISCTRIHTHTNETTTKKNKKEAIENGMLLHCNGSEWDVRSLIANNQHHRSTSTMLSLYLFLSLSISLYSHDALTHTHIHIHLNRYFV